MDGHPSEEQGLIKSRQHPTDHARREAREAVPGALVAPAGAHAERAARATLRAQIARLEGDVSQLLAQRFPFVHAPPLPSRARPSGPHLPGLGELERARDSLAAQLQLLRARAERRGEHERRARELLERMRLEPGRYKYYRVPVRDLGESGCGVWEVRPRLGLIGMLAGWWELTLSSGCP